MAKFVIAYFLEDAGHEAIIPPLMKRLIREEKKPTDDFEHKLLSSRGGGSVVAFKAFLEDAERNSLLAADLLVVASDGNCQGFAAKRNALLAIAPNQTYPRVITAIPDPHVERWFLLDGSALKNAATLVHQPQLPAYKCEKGFYKKLLRSAFERGRVFPLLGGIEYGPEVAENMNLYSSGKLDHGFKDFIDQGRDWLRTLE